MCTNDLNVLYQFELGGIFFCGIDCIRGFLIQSLFKAVINNVTVCKPFKFVPLQFHISRFQGFSILDFNAFSSWSNTLEIISSIFFEIFIECCLSLQLAGVVAVEVTGGPTVEFVPGRKVCDNVMLRGSIYSGWYNMLRFSQHHFRILMCVPRKGGFQMRNKVLKIICQHFHMLGPYCYQRI